MQLRKMTVPTIRLLLIGIAVLAGYSWAQTPCEDLEAKEECLNNLFNEILDDTDRCSRLDEFTSTLDGCEENVAGCEDELNGLVQEVRSFLDAVTEACPAEQQCTIEDHDRLDCLKPLNPDMLSAKCNLTPADVDAAFDCVLGLANEECKEEIRSQHDRREQAKTDLIDEQLRQQQLCDIVSDPSCPNIDNMAESLEACSSGNPEGPIDFDTFCVTTQAMLDCVDKFLSCEKLEKMLNFGSIISAISLLGCTLTYKGKTIPTSSDCNIRETLNCYADIQASMQVLGHVTDGVSFYAWVNKPQSDVCQAVKDYTDAQWDTLATCVHTHSSGCEKPNPRPLESTSGIPPINIGFLRRRDAMDWKNYCSEGCNDITSQRESVNQCFSGLDIHAMTRNENCTSLQMLMNCLEPKIDTCPVLQASWLDFVGDYSMRGLANLFTSCSQSLGVADCLHKETQEEDIKAKCYDDDVQLIQDRYNLCGRLEGFTRCVKDHSFGCSRLTRTYIEPHYAYFSAMNHAYGCSIEYRGEHIEVTTSDNCQQEHYLQCLDDLTTSLGLPNFATQTVPESGSKPAPQNVTSAVAILSPFHYLNKHKMVCDAVMEVDFDAIDNCLSEQASLCSRSDAGAVHHPMTFDMERIKGDAESACSVDCVDVDPNNVTSGCVQNLQLMCSSVDAQNIFGRDVSEVCQELQEAWTCMKGAAGQCEYAISQLQSLWIDDCESASLTCFGIGVPTTSTTTTTTTTSRPSNAAGDARAWIGMMWIGLVGWMVSM